MIRSPPRTGTAGPGSGWSDPARNGTDGVSRVTGPRATHSTPEQALRTQSQASRSFNLRPVQLLQTPWAPLRSIFGGDRTGTSAADSLLRSARRQPRTEGLGTPSVLETRGRNGPVSARPPAGPPTIGFYDVPPSDRPGAIGSVGRSPARAGSRPIMARVISARRSSSTSPCARPSRRGTPTDRNLGPGSSLPPEWSP